MNPTPALVQFCRGARTIAVQIFAHVSIRPSRWDALFNGLAETEGALRFRALIRARLMAGPKQ